MFFVTKHALTSKCIWSKTRLHSKLHLTQVNENKLTSRGDHVMTKLMSRWCVISMQNGRAFAVQCEVNFACLRSLFSLIVNFLLVCIKRSFNEEYFASVFLFWSNLAALCFFATSWEGWAEQHSFEPHLCSIYTKVQFQSVPRKVWNNKVIEKCTYACSKVYSSHNEDSMLFPFFKRKYICKGVGHLNK